ncbi:hypothetical protein [Maribacter sp. HTCC2170]|uniref:hypothetical protein n=1 Tax=Maribacter sp. (strain HTCC2170 / KCCM 42371) TaxID=313603 RepID=UPI00006AFCFB|nr:hypothetical protein [Maribacter sp. HTCC2170]EAR01415.1 hypothetical protein FB2170_11861 [Maribacter sp. HTCC2170]
MKQLILLFGLLLTVQVSTANVTFQDGDGVIKAKAKELTKKYKAELGLDEAQTAKFETIVANYMMKKSKAKGANISDGDKAVMIKQLSIQESEDIEDVLSKSQYKKYLKAKMKLQP